MATAELFRAFATEEARGRSPLYERLALGVAEDTDLLRLLDSVAPRSRQPNLLFAVVQFLDGVPHEYGTFRQLVLDRANEVTALLRRRRTQTNEVGRCSILLPVLARIGGPLALLEVGASAGLCLVPDRYHYLYGDLSAGDPTSRLHLSCEARGSPPIPAQLPQIVWRRGIDLDPVDLTSKEDVRWLEACVWADQPERLQRLRTAVTIAATDPPHVVSGDLLEETARCAEEAPEHATTVIFHSAVLAYLSREERHQFAEIVADLPAVWISNEAAGVIDSVPEAVIRVADRHGAFVVAEGPRTPLALGDPHGRWLDWLPAN